MKYVCTLFITVHFFSFALAQNKNYTVNAPEQNHPVGRLFHNALADRNIGFSQKELRIPVSGKTLVLAVQEYYFLQDSSPSKLKKGALFGHGWISNNASWIHYVERSLENGVQPVTLIWPGHGMNFEPLKEGALRSYIVNAEVGDHRPDHWIDFVGPALDHYMRSQFQEYSYWGYSMGDMLGSVMNHRGLLNPDFMVMIGGPNNFDYIPKATRGLIQWRRWLNQGIHSTGLSDYDPMWGHVPKSSDAWEYQMLGQALIWPSLVKSTLLARPEFFGIGSFSRDYNEWFAEGVLNDYPWRDLELRSPTLFVWGNREEISDQALRATYQARGQNIWWSELEIPTNHVGEVSRQSSLDVWAAFKSMVADHGTLPRESRYYRKLPSSKMGGESAQRKTSASCRRAFKK